MRWSWQYVKNDSLMNSEPLSESMPSSEKGSFARICCNPAKLHTCALFFKGTHTVQPVATSVALSVKACKLSITPPSWPTRSISRKPGRCSFAEGAQWDLVLEQSAGPGVRSPFELILLSFRSQQAINGGRAHASQLPASLRLTLEFTAPIE